MNRILARPSGTSSGEIRTPEGGEWAADSEAALKLLLEAYFPGLNNLIYQDQVEDPVSYETD